MGGGGGLGGGGCWDAPAARRPATSLPSYARRGTSLACATARRPGKEGGRPRGGWIHWDLLTLRLGATGNPLLRTVRYIVLLNTRGISTIRVQFRLGLYLADLADFTSAARRHRCRRRGGGGGGGRSRARPHRCQCLPTLGRTAVSLGAPSLARRWGRTPWSILLLGCGADRRPVCHHGAFAFDRAVQRGCRRVGRVRRTRRCAPAGAF